MPKNIIIFTVPGDIHACVVDYALKLSGANSTLFNTANVLVGESISVHYLDTGTVVRLGSFEGPINNVNSSWLRRVSTLLTTPPNAHPADLTYLQGGARSTLTGIIELLQARFPVNPVYSAYVQANKLAQLRVAAASGFRIPRTLISNNSTDILDFLSVTPDACVKPHRPQTWRNDDGLHQALNVRLRHGMNIPRESLELSPHIYQEFIEKKAEYRLTMFGGYSAAVRIDTRALLGNASVDWRSDPSYRSHLSPYTLPEQVVERARSVMRRLNLRFGSFDLAETESGDFVFFEVNEEGQWIWQELQCPDCRILQPLTEYLLSASDEFEWSVARASPEFDASRIHSEAIRDSYYQSLLRSQSPDEPIFLSDERATSEGAGSAGVQ